MSSRKDRDLAVEDIRERRCIRSFDAPPCTECGELLNAYESQGEELDTALERARVAESENAALSREIREAVEAASEIDGPNTGPGVAGLMRLASEELVSLRVRLEDALERARVAGEGLRLASCRGLRLSDVMKIVSHGVNGRPEECRAYAELAAEQAEKYGGQHAADRIRAMLRPEDEMRYVSVPSVALAARYRNPYEHAIQTLAAYHSLPPDLPPMDVARKVAEAFQEVQRERDAARATGVPGCDRSESDE